MVCHRILKRPTVVQLGVNPYAGPYGLLRYGFHYRKRRRLSILQVWGVWCPSILHRTYTLKTMYLAYGLLYGPYISIRYRTFTNTMGAHSP